MDECNLGKNFLPRLRPRVVGKTMRKDREKGLVPFFPSSTGKQFRETGLGPFVKGFACALCATRLKTACYTGDSIAKGALAKAPYGFIHQSSVQHHTTLTQVDHPLVTPIPIVSQTNEEESRRTLVSVKYLIDSEKDRK